MISFAGQRHDALFDCQLSGEAARSIHLFSKSLELIEGLLKRAGFETARRRP